MKKLKKEARGITLIALVVTIIVLLILAGIAINLTIGNNGLFSRAEEAALESGGGAVEEAKELWKTDVALAKYANEEPGETRAKLLERLLKENKITEKEKKEIEETGKVTIGSRTIEFGDEVGVNEEFKDYTLVARDAGLEIEIRMEKLLRYVVINLNGLPNKLTDEELFMKLVVKNEDMTFEQFVDECIKSGTINTRYTTLKEAMMGPEEGMTEA